MKNEYELIYIGSGPIFLLDALNEKLKGKKVLIIDKSSKIGGAWSELNIFGISGLENAVHYLMPNDSGYEFIEKNLKIKLLKSYKKYYARSFFSKNLLIKNISFLGRLINSYESSFGSPIKFIKILLLGSASTNSKYPKKGSKIILDKIRFILKKLKIDVHLDTEVKAINIGKKHVKLSTNNRIYFADKLVISHGFIPPKNFSNLSKKVNITKKKFPRPSIHIFYDMDKNLLKSNYCADFSQVIFGKNSNIKYVHELTQFVGSINQFKSKGVLVVALKHDLKNNKITLKKIVNELEDFNLLPKSRFRKEIKFYWQDIHLPMLYTEDLEYLKSISLNKIKLMLTEELCTGIGLYSNTWSDLKRFLKSNNIFED